MDMTGKKELANISLRDTAERSKGVATYLMLLRKEYNVIRSPVLVLLAGFPQVLFFELNYRLPPQVYWAISRPFTAPLWPW